MDKCDIITILIIIVMAFIILGHCYREQIQAPLKYEIVKIGGVVIDWWSITHLVFYLAVGLIDAGHFWRWFWLGAAFELFEDFLSADKNTQLVNCVKNKNTLIGKLWCCGIQDDYWYGKWDDIAMNAIGYAIGEYIARGKLSIL